MPGDSWGGPGTPSPLLGDTVVSQDRHALWHSLTDADKVTFEADIEILREQ